MTRFTFCRTEPNMLAVLDELDSLITVLKNIISSLEPQSTSSVDLNQIIERTERLRTKIACMSNNDLDLVATLQAIVCIAQYLTKLWE